MPVDKHKYNWQKLQKKSFSMNRKKHSYRNKKWNFLDDDREEVATVITTIIPALNASELEEEEDASNRPKGLIASTTFINEVAANHDEEKKELCEKIRQGRFDEIVK